MKILLLVAALSLSLIALADGNKPKGQEVPRPKQDKGVKQGN